jgi:hypothetical protein
VLAFALLACAGMRAQAGEPFDAAGDAGRTSYRTLPFVSQVYANCWGCSVGLAPAELYFEANPDGFLRDPEHLRLAREAATALEQHGIVPSGGAQLWEDTYIASFPSGTFSDEPPAVQQTRNQGFPTMPDFVAWRDFVAGHPQYWDIAYDGGTMPPTFRPWTAQWGYISPLTPLDAADCPPGMTACTWGDALAYRWSLSAQRTGSYGIQLSDFFDSQPHYLSTYHDFNPRIVAAFERAESVDVPAGDTRFQATWIVAHAFAKWNDFLAAGFSRYFGALAQRTGAATHRVGLVVDQCSWTPAAERMRGVDARVIAKTMDAKSYVCVWDEHLIQGDRPGPIARPPMQELAGSVINAAREPRIRNGANLEADSAGYRAAIAQFYPSLDSAAQRDVGQKLLKRLWLWSAWAHIADADGHVRRALALIGRDYWDDGDLKILDPLTSLIQSITPTRPFGPALYYPVSVERAIEEREGAAVGAAGVPETYLPLAQLQPLLDAHGLGYYVSDAAIGRIHKGDAAAPSAWVVLGAQGLLPDAERQQLAAIAPVATSAEELAALPDQPVGFPQGTAGFGFYDQTSRLILVVSNPDTHANAKPVSGAVQLACLAPGRYRATDLFTGAKSEISAAAGAATSLPVALGRWDTMVIAIEPESAKAHAPCTAG